MSGCLAFYRKEYPFALKACDNTQILTGLLSWSSLVAAPCISIKRWLLDAAKHSFNFVSLICVQKRFESVVRRIIPEVNTRYLNQILTIPSAMQSF